MEMIEWAATRHKREQIRLQQLQQQTQVLDQQALEQQRVQAQQAAIAGGSMPQTQPAAVPAVSFLLSLLWVMKLDIWSFMWSIFLLLCVFDDESVCKFTRTTSK